MSATITIDGAPEIIECRGANIKMMCKVDSDNSEGFLVYMDRVPPNVDNK